jgi:hypothetical protein
MAKISQTTIDIKIVKLTPTANIMHVTNFSLNVLNRIYDVLIYDRPTFKEFKKNPSAISINSSVKVLNGAFHQKLIHKLSHLEYINLTCFRYFIPMKMNGSVITNVTNSIVICLLKRTARKGES